ncbi:MAG TPA: ferritin family protein, partial [Candidatus Cloacimonas acidaminovorans]|nr:ferritin family protein [Candidatus Cloacimonas acidaminovorans]
FPLYLFVNIVFFPLYLFVFHLSTSHYIPFAFFAQSDYNVINREVKQMTLEDSYRMVIAEEIRAQKMYQALAKSFAKPETSNVFKELVVLEKMHEEKVRSAFAKEFPGQTITLQEEPIKEMQGVNWNDPQEVLEFAITKEEESVELYKNMAEQTREPEIKKQLLQFAKEEEGHKSILLSEIQRLQGALQWFDPSELSGLMED